MVTQRLSAKERRGDGCTSDELASSTAQFEDGPLLLIQRALGLVVGQQVSAWVDLSWGHRHDDVFRDGRL
jgi:hypothetical protein